MMEAEAVNPEPNAVAPAVPAATTATEATAPIESVGFGSLLARSRSSDPIVETPAVVPEAPAPVEPIATDPNGGVVPQVAPAAPAVPAAVIPPPNTIEDEVVRRTRGLIGALTSERQKRQELEQAMQQLNGTTVPIDSAQSEIQSLKNQLLKQSEMLARQIHTDYDEVYSHFEKEVASNPVLLETVLNAEVPAEAAYQAGLNLKLARELGPEVLGNPMKLRSAIEKSVREDERAKVTKEYEAKFATKAHERSKTPTDISKARAGGGGSVGEYQTPGFGGLLMSVRHRKR